MEVGQELPIFIPMKHSLALLCLLLHTLLPAQENHTLQLPGLKAPVEVLRDEWGINHIYAKNQHDLFFAQGYCAAKDRLFQFETWRRQATGTAAEILGPKELKRDIGARLFRFRGNFQQEWEHYHPQGKEIILAFTDGINARIREVRQHPELLPDVFKKLNLQPEYWTPEVVISRHASIMYNANQELNFARAVLRSNPQTVQDLFWFHPRTPDLTLDPSFTKAMFDQDILGLYNAFKKELNFSNTSDDLASLDPQASFDGSNNWIVSTQKSASGFPLLANDPHRKIALPSLRYLVHLVAPGWNVIGAGEPTIPGVSIGHNQFGAWGLTIAETDAEDLYVYDIHPSNPELYSYKGNWVPMTTIKDTIRVKNAPGEIVTHRFTVHGPVTFTDRKANKAYALRCGWLEPGGAPYLASLRMDQAKNWEDFRKACSFNHMPGENMIWADKKRNTGWQVAGIQPVRPNHSGYIPVPGDGRFDWQGFFPIAQRPHALNPASGFLATANEQVTPTDYPYPQQTGSSWSDPYRGQRIREVLASGKELTIKDMADLQHDYLSIPARQLVPLLNNISFTDETERKAADLLSTWDYKLKKNSSAAAIYVMWERELITAARNYFIPDSLKPFITLHLHRIIEQLQKPIIHFGAASQLDRTILLKETFSKAIQACKKKLGADMNQWVYGQPSFKHVRLSNPLLTNNPLGPLPRSGNAYTPGATGASDNQSHGASFRIVVDTKDWNQTLMINTPGQSEDPSSPYFSNLFQRWANDEFFPAYYSREKIRKHTKERLVLQPE